MMTDQNNPGPGHKGGGGGGGDAGGGRSTGQNVSSTTRTTTTTTSPAAVSLDWIKFDLFYFRTLPGILKIVQWVLGILCMACGSGAFYGGQHFFLFVVVLTFILTFLWICIYFFSIREGLQLPIPWIILEFYYTAGAALLYCIAMIVQFATPHHRTSFVVSAIFGLFNTIAYAAGAFLLFKDWKQNTATSNAPNVP